jgi:hypothetical protein
MLGFVRDNPMVKRRVEYCKEVVAFLVGCDHMEQWLRRNHCRMQNGVTSPKRIVGLFSPASNLSSSCWAVDGQMVFQLKNEMHIRVDQLKLRRREDFSRWIERENRQHQAANTPVGIYLRHSLKSNIGKLLVTKQILHLKPVTLTCFHHCKQVPVAPSRLKNCKKRPVIQIKKAVEPQMDHTNQVRSSG